MIFILLSFRLSISTTKHKNIKTFLHALEFVIWMGLKVFRLSEYATFYLHFIAVQCKNDEPMMYKKSN